MKKFLFLILFGGTFIACSSDDDAPATGDDPIIGTWALVDVVDASGAFNEYFCEDPQSTITFNPDNTGEAAFYLTDRDCSAEGNTGNWQNNGNSSYNIEIPVVGNLTGNVSFTGDDQFTFASQFGANLTFERFERLD